MKIYRSIIKYPVSTALNILSLAIAFTGIITIVQYVSYEKSFDKHNINYSTVYQLQIDGKESTVPAVYSPVLRKNVADIVDITPLWFAGGYISIQKQDEKPKSYYISNVYANDDIFNIFTCNFIYGSDKDALKKANSIVLTERVSKKLFGNINPVGKTIKFRNQEYTCTGLIEDLPETSSFKTESFTSFETLLEKENSFAKLWSEWSFRIFLRISSPERYNEVLKSINSIDEINKVLHKSLDRESDGDRHFTLQPMSNLHFLEGGMYQTVNPVVLDVLILLAIILAIMGIVNFINLLTSQAVQRSKSFAIKRILGASRYRLFFQIIIEAIIISLVALGIALLLHGYFYPTIETKLDIKGLSFEGRQQWYIYFTLFTIVYAIVASIYPAKYITSVDVAQTVKGTYRFSGAGKKIRNILLTMQFVFTIVLLIGSIAIEKQIAFWHNYNTGIEKENIVYFTISSEIGKHKEAFNKELSKLKNVVDYTYSWFIPGGVGMGWGRVINGQQITLYTWPVDERFLDFFNIQIVEGRKFSSNQKADLNSFIVNEKAVEEFNWNKPLEIKMIGFDFEGPIIGVCKDFNYSSLKEKIVPMQFWLTDTRLNTLMLKISEGNMTSALSSITSLWQKFEPKQTIDIHFLDESLNDQYGKEEKIANFIEAITLWTILLTLTGLMGLAIFVTQQRTKEIGIRRANGASVGEIIMMLNYSFVKWILFAFIIGSPIAYIAVDKWLENFAYKTHISWWIFAFAGILTLVLSILAVSIQTFRVARKNPVESLRYE